MLFSAHVVDTNPLQAIRRKTPSAGSVAGLKSARVGISAPFSKGAFPRPQLGREALIACWEDDAALDAFLAEDAAGQVFAAGWHARLELVRAVGTFPGVNEDLSAVAGDKYRDMTGPSVAFTLGTAYAKSIPEFLRVTGGLEEQFLATPTGLWGTGMSNVVQRFVATITVWESIEAATEYVRTGAHGAAATKHYDPAKDPNGHTFVSDGGFLGFRPLSVSGSITGKNARPAGLLGV